MLNIGIMGLHHSHAPGHAATISSLSEHAKLVAVAHDDRGETEAFAQKFGIDAVDYETLLSRDDIDTVVVCRNSEHSAAACIEAAQAGKHIMCEKPLGISAAEADAVARAVREAGVVLQVAFTLRFDRLYMAAKKLLASGAIGTLVNMWSARRHRNVIKPFWGGGETLEHGVHDYDLLRWYAGSEVQSVFALANQVNNSGNSVGPVRFPNPIPEKLPYESTSIVTLRFSDGVIAGLTFGSISPENQPHWADATLELVGTEGVIRASMTSETLSLHTNDGVRYPRIADGLPPKYKGMYLEFFRAVEYGREPSGGLRDGVMATRIADAAYASIRQGMPQAVSVEGEKPVT